MLLVAFVLHELRAENPMLPMRLFRNRAFTAINTASLLMFLGMFGSIFLLSQFLQGVQGYTPDRGRACGCCRGPRCRWSSRRSPACSPTGSAAARSSSPGSACRPSGSPGSR